MWPCPSGGTSHLRLFALCLLAVLSSLSGIFRAAAQTPQPWLFVETIANGKATGAVKFLRDDSSGGLTQLANSQYTVDAITGAAREVSTSSYQASTGQFGVLVPINGTAVTAVTFVAAAGATLSPSVSAGQTAQFNLQAMPGTGFNGTLTFACSGAPTGANCSAPSVTVTNGAPVNFTVTVTTSGSAGMARGAPGKIPSVPRYSPVATTLLLLLLAIWFYFRKREREEIPAAAFDWKRVFALACLALAVNGCGGGSSPRSVEQQPPPPVITPSGTYTITVTPSATPAGSTKSFPLSPISLTLVVK